MHNVYIELIFHQWWCNYLIYILCLFYLTSPACISVDWNRQWDDLGCYHLSDPSDLASLVMSLEGSNLTLLSTTASSRADPVRSCFFAVRLLGYKVQSNTLLLLFWWGFPLSIGLLMCHCRAIQLLHVYQLLERFSTSFPSFITHFDNLRPALLYGGREVGDLLSRMFC